MSCHYMDLHTATDVTSKKTCAKLKIGSYSGNEIRVNFVLTEFHFVYTKTLKSCENEIHCLSIIMALNLRSGKLR